MRVRHDPWPLPPNHRPTGYCILDGHGTEPWRMVSMLPIERRQRLDLGTLLICPMHDGDAADGERTSPMFNKPMCTIDDKCRMRDRHEGKCVHLAREMRR
jgi:hypothetical protein